MLLSASHPEASHGELHKKRETYETNNAMASYLIQAAPEVHQLLLTRAFSEHNLGTCFEALLHLTVSRSETNV